MITLTYKNKNASGFIAIFFPLFFLSLSLSLVSLPPSLKIVSTKISPVSFWKKSIMIYMWEKYAGVEEGI